MQYRLHRKLSIKKETMKTDAALDKILQIRTSVTHRLIALVAVILEANQPNRKVTIKETLSST